MSRSEILYGLVIRRLGGCGTLARNTIITAITPLHPLIVVTRPTPIQQKAFDLLGLTV